MMEDQQMNFTRLDGLIENLVQTAGEAELYGKLPPLEMYLRQHEFEAALDLVSGIRMHDNLPVVHSFKRTLMLRHNEYLLMQLEAGIIYLINVADPAATPV